MFFLYVIIKAHASIVLKMVFVAVQIKYQGKLQKLGIVRSSFPEFSIIKSSDLYAYYTGQHTNLEIKSPCLHQNFEDRRVKNK